MKEKNTDDMTQEKLRAFIEEKESGGLCSGDDDEYDYVIALQVAMLMEKDVEAFKKLSPEEQEEKYREYKKEMDALSDEELVERHDKYFR